MIKRSDYLNKLQSVKDTDLIKVVTGVRRSGKSTLLEMFRQKLLDENVPAANIISVNFEEMENQPLRDKKLLHAHILKQLGRGKNYVFLDEIQMVPEFEEVVDSLYVKPNIDLYITGSNAYFLSSDLATLLTGRYIEIKVFPLSFAEYVSAFDDKSRLDLRFNDYLVYGGFPEVANLLKAGQKDVVNDYMLGIYNTVITKDIVERNGITDVTTLGSIARFVLDSVGSLISPHKIAGYLTSQNNKTSRTTVDKYLAALVDGLIFYRADRKDIKGKQLLQTQQKYYPVDTGFRRVLLGNSAALEVGHLLESVVYFELLRRRNFVWVGKQKEYEVDFVARNIDTNEVVYYQVAYTAKDENVLSRELRPLKAVNDHNQKFLLTTDVGLYEYSGVKQLNVVDWLLSEPLSRI
jgi:predicted AAA+ superfamily ATPase